MVARCDAVVEDKEHGVVLGKHRCKGRPWQLRFVEGNGPVRLCRRHADKFDQGRRVVIGDGSEE